MFAVKLNSQTEIEALRKTFQNSKSDTDKARACLYIANYYSNNIADSAIYYSDLALTLLKNAPDEKMEAWAHRNKANGYFSMQKYNESIKQLFISIKLYELLNDTVEIARTYQYAGSILYEVSSEEKSLFYFHRAMALLKNKSNTDILASIYNDFSYIYSKKGNYDSSIYYQLKAYEIDQQSNALDKEENLASDEHNIGAIYFQLGEYKKAEDYIKKSYEKRIKLGYKLPILSSLNVLSAIAIKNKDYEAALITTHEAAKLAQELKSTNDLIIVFERYKLIYNRLKKYELSDDYADSTIFALKKLNNEEGIRISNETEAKFQNEKKEIENKELKSKNELSEKIIKQQKTTFYVVIIALITAMALVYFIYIGLKKQRLANKTIERQKHEAELKNKIIEEKQKEILDSIHYAKRIQSTLLTQKDFINSNLKDNFILFKPKDIVSGDFYWATKREHLFYLAVCDSTGHGVPGAFMSLLSINFLNEAINERKIETPDHIFNFVREKLIDNLSKDGQQDGFDGTLLCFNQKTKQITYAAAHNSPIIIRNNEVLILEADKMPVGKGISEAQFKLFELKHEPGDCLYLYTDGYADQFGGPRGKKYMYKQLNQFILSISNTDMQSQFEKLDLNFNTWRGNLEQVDDVCILGIKL